MLKETSTFRLLAHRGTFLGSTFATTALISALASGGCSATLSFQQCLEDSDCGEGQVCNDNNICEDANDTNAEDESADGPETSTSGDGDGDTSGDGDSTGDGDGDGDMPCTTNSECHEAFSMDYVCGVQGECVSLLTSQCDHVTWPANHDVDKVVWMASLMDTSPPFDELIQPLENSVQLAVNDFNGEAELQGGRKVGWIACDVTGGPTAAVNAATHLVENIGVPAFIGPIFSESVIAVAEQVTIPAGVMMMAPGATSKNITDLDDNNLVWRTIASDVYQANAVVDTVAVDIGALGQPAPTKIVILYKDDEYGGNLLQDTISGLNNAIGDANVSTVDYPDPATFTDMKALTQALSLAVGQAYAQAPDYVILYGTSEAANIIQGYTGAYAQAVQLDPMNTPPLPRFLVTHGAVPSMEDTVRGLESLGLGALESTVNALLEGTSPAIQDPVNFADYNIRYGIAFNDEEALTASGLSYDGALTIMFSMATVLPDDEITGERIASGIGRLTDKDATTIAFTGLDLAFIEEARNTLVTGQNIDMHGVSGQLDFDLTTGDVRQDQVRWKLTDIDGDPMDAAATPVLTPFRYYLLNPDPATDGTWIPFPTP